MTSPRPKEILVVGAGAAGLMAARDLARNGHKVTIVEARERCGGRIMPLPPDEFGYPAEGGAEFIHGEAPLTRALAREAGLSIAAVDGSRWSGAAGKLTQTDFAPEHPAELHRALERLDKDVPIADFLRTHFAGPRYAAMRRSITSMVEGYDAADPNRASTFALRDEWMDEGLNHRQDRIVEGYGALIAYLARECGQRSVVFRLETEVVGINSVGHRVCVRCRNGENFDVDAVILTVPPPLIASLALPPDVQARAGAVADIGFGAVAKIVLRFKSRWWVEHDRDMATMSFLRGEAAVPTWWTQSPSEAPVLTGWLAGPRAEALAHTSADGLLELGLGALGSIFGIPLAEPRQNLLAHSSVNWSGEPFSRGGYSYATPQTREAQARLEARDGSAVIFSGEALYAGRDMGTVEAALSSGRDAAQRLIG